MWYRKICESRIKKVKIDSSGTDFRNKESFGDKLFIKKIIRFRYGNIEFRFIGV